MGLPELVRRAPSNIKPAASSKPLNCDSCVDTITMQAALINYCILCMYSIHIFIPLICSETEPRLIPKGLAEHKWYKEGVIMEMI